MEHGIYFQLKNSSFYEEQLRCAHKPSYLLALIHKKTGQLPHTFHIQKLYIDDYRQLKSLMLSSTPLQSIWILDGYTFTVQQQKVCPKIVKTDPVIGCHNCETSSVLPITAMSTCPMGIADVELQPIILLTSILNLTNTEQSFEIKSKAMQQCITRNLCLKYKRSSSCEPIKFWLADPDIALVQPNVTITTSVCQMQAGYSFWSIVTAPFSVLSAFSLTYILYLICDVNAIIFSYLLFKHVFESTKIVS